MNISNNSSQILPWRKRRKHRVNVQKITSKSKSYNEHNNPIITRNMKWYMKDKEYENDFTQTSVNNNI